MAFTNYLDMLPNLTMPSLIKDRTTYEQPLLINLTFPVFDNLFKGTPTDLKSFMHNYAKSKEIFYFGQRHVSTVKSLKILTKISFPITCL